MGTKVARVEPRLRLVRGQSASTPAAPAPLPSRPAFDDSELLLAIRRGETGTAAALYDRVRPQVERTVRRLLGARDPDVCDLAQQSMIEIVRTIDRYRGECSLDSWTSAVAAHVVYKHIRRRRTERRIFGAFDADWVDEARSSSRIAREAIVRNLMRRVLAHLDQIDEAKAWAFVLHDVCGYDLREIAKITGVSAAAAQTRLVRGRREIHERIANDPELANLLESMEGHS
jgi:RNA polymerase sigma-70 factor, ECF subfamily